MRPKLLCVCVDSQAAAVAPILFDEGTIPEIRETTSFISAESEAFVYRVGETKYVDNFVSDKKRHRECGSQQPGFYFHRNLEDLAVWREFCPSEIKRNWDWQTDPAHLEQVRQEFPRLFIDVDLKAYTPPKYEILAGPEHKSSTTTATVTGAGGAAGAGDHEDRKDHVGACSASVDAGPASASGWDEADAVLAALLQQTADTDAHSASQPRYAPGDAKRPQRQPSDHNSYLELPPDSAVPVASAQSASRQRDDTKFKPVVVQSSNQRDIDYGRYASLTSAAAAAASATGAASAASVAEADLSTSVRSRRTWHQTADALGDIGAAPRG